MTHRPDRDAEFDRILRRFAGPDAPSPSDQSASAGCLDAETVAAMADGGLLPHEQAAAMSHVSTCARCQAVLAAVIRTMPESEPARAWWRLPALRWLTPIVATGVAVAVWVAAGNRPPAVTSISAPVEVSAPAQAPNPPAGVPSADQRQAGAVAEAARPAANASQESRKERAKSSLRVDQLSAARQKDEASLDKTVAAEPAAKAVAATPPPASPVPPAPAPAAQAAQTASSNAAAPAASAGGAGRSGAGDQFRALADRVGVAGAVAERQFVATDILSSDPRARWRIVGNTVQRLTDGGVTWVDQTTGTAVRLTAGSAPQPDICWIVGDAGTVLLSIDGLSWQRLTPPVQAALVAVSATSADAATVTAGDGRAYVTTDRGRTWQPR